jgi:RNase P subunit RPR2
MTKKAFCANCQTDTAHQLEADMNGEIVLTCDCGRFQKLPAGLSKKGMEKELASRKENNQGQVSLEEFVRAAEDLADASDEE